MVTNTNAVRTTGVVSPNDEQVNRLIYLSRAAAGFDADSLSELAEIASVNNRVLGVTGWLTYRANEFVQQLEGTADAVNELFDRIAQDERHTIVRSHELPPGERRFDSWSMVLMDPHWLVEWSLDELVNDAVRDLRSVDPDTSTPQTLTLLDGRVAQAHDELAGRS